MSHLGALSLAAKIRKARRLAPSALPDPQYTVERHLLQRRTHWEEIQQRYFASPQASHGALFASVAASGTQPTGEATVDAEAIVR